MSQFATILRVRTRGRGLYEFTGDVVEWVDAHALETGLLTLFCRHTSASLLIQENAAPAVRDDLEACFEGLAPEDKGRYSHDDEGPDDMPAHIRAALTAPSACRSRSSRAGWRWEPGRASTCSSTVAPRTCARSPPTCSDPESLTHTQTVILAKARIQTRSAVAAAKSLGLRLRGATMSFC
jgi:secondary thiamine-phosphate synthase enzyme